MFVLSVHLPLVTTVYFGKAAHSVEMLFRVVDWVGIRYYGVRWGLDSPWQWGDFM